MNCFPIFVVAYNSINDTIQDSQPNSFNMKKLSTLFLILLTTLIGFAQVQNQPNMVRIDFGQEELDYTTYDWQTDKDNITRECAETLSHLQISYEPHHPVMMTSGTNTLDISNLGCDIYFISAGNDTQKLVVK